MKRLTTYLNERLVVNKNYNPYTCSPISWQELRQIIEERYKKLGPGTKQNPIDFNDIDISKLETLVSDKKRGVRGVFEETNFEYIDISDWDVSNVKNMGGMFYGCKKLTSVGDLSNWNVSNVKEMYSMFSNCKKLTSIGDIEKWDVSNVKHMTCMFSNCNKLTSVGDISEWDVSGVKNMLYMFSHSGITNTPNWYKG